MNRVLGLILLATAVFAAGCIGGKSVESSYLRVGNGSKLNPACEKVKHGVPKLAIKRFTSLPALDRETVIIAKGAVLKPDYRWSWEGTPAEIFDLAAGPALSCMNSYEVVTPYRPGIERALVLSGVIMSFELQRSEGNKFIAAVRYSLWDGSGKNLLARKFIESSVAVERLDGASIASAADKAMESVMNKTVNWIDSLGGEMLSQDQMR